VLAAQYEPLRQAQKRLPAECDARRIGDDDLAPFAVRDEVRGTLETQRSRNWEHLKRRIGPRNPQARDQGCRRIDRLRERRCAGRAGCNDDGVITAAQRCNPVHRAVDQNETRPALAQTDRNAAQRIRQRRTRNLETARRAHARKHDRPKRARFSGKRKDLGGRMRRQEGGCRRDQRSRAQIQTRLRRAVERIGRLTVASDRTQSKHRRLAPQRVANRGDRNRLARVLARADHGERTRTGRSCASEQRGSHVHTNALRRARSARLRRRHAPGGSGPPQRLARE